MEIKVKNIIELLDENKVCHLIDIETDEILETYDGKNSFSGVYDNWNISEISANENEINITINDYI